MKLHATAAGHEVGPSKRQSSGQRSSIVSPGSSNHESNRALSLGGGVVPMSPLALGGGGAGHGRLEGMTAAEKLRVEREEERARRHLSRHKRRHSIAVSNYSCEVSRYFRRWGFNECAMQFSRHLSVLPRWLSYGVATTSWLEAFGSTLFKVANIASEVSQAVQGTLISTNK